MEESKRAPSLVSVVIPVYNAEKYLGYCLNSVMSQTYAHLDVVVVNDGSTDGSLEICQNYAAADPRFRVFDIPNGGVSNARNFAMTQVRGSYVTFVDSDDTIHPEMIEWMVAAEESAHTGLVVGNMQFVDFSAGEILPKTLTSAWAGSQQCFSKEEFRLKKMQLIWHTSLLENLCCKLYSVDIWKANHVLCPPDVSLGEDFLANMPYYAACNGACFLNKTVYYYNNVQDSDSLSHKYRPGLFQNKMMLTEALEAHLGGIDQLSDEERMAFYDYVAASGLFCVTSILCAKTADQEEKRRILKEMAAHAAFIEALSKAPHILPQYKAYVPLLVNNRIDKLLALPVRKIAAQKRKLKAEAKSGVINRMLRKALRFSAAALGDTSISRKLSNLEQSLLHEGIKKTLVRYVLKR